MTLSVRRGYRKMQPIFFSFVSGLHYRKTVKLYLSRISAFDLVVSICENMLFQCFSSFLTAGNKSYCGTFQRLTHPRQSTVEPILRPASSQNRQASQRKTFALSSASTQTSSHLRKHRTSVLSTPQKLPGAPQPHLRHSPNAPPAAPRRPPATATAAPQPLPGDPQPHLDTPPDAPLPPHPHSLLTPATPPMCPSLPKSACNSRTGVTQRHEVIQTSNILRGNCMRNC